MFSRTKEPEAAQAVVPTAKAQRATRSNVPTIISADLVVKGSLISAGDVQVDGKVEGDIRAGALVIGEKAIIEGDIYAEDAVIRGRVQGCIRARKVQLCSTCHVEGNILHEALAMETGAFFEGNCRHSDNPLADDADGSIQRRPASQAQLLERRPTPPQATATPIRAATGLEDTRPIVAARPAPAAIASAEYKPIKG